MSRAPCSRKQTGHTMHVRTYQVLLLIRTLIGTYMVVCCFVQGGLHCCAVLTVQRHTYSSILLRYCSLLYTYRYSIRKRFFKKGKWRLLYKMLEDIHAGSRQLSACMLALSSGMYERALQSTAQHGTGRHRTQGTTPHCTARRRTAPLS